MSPASLYAPDPGGGQARVGSHMELMGGHSSSRREGPARQLGAGGRWLLSTPGTLGLTGQPSQGQAERSQPALSSPVSLLPHLNDRPLCPFAMCLGDHWASLAAH